MELRALRRNSSFITKEMYHKVGLYKVDFKYMMDLDLFMRLFKLKAKHKYVDVCVLTFRVGGTSSAMSRDYLQERRRLIKENGGNRWDTFLYIGYHRIKWLIKKLYFMIYPK